MKVIVVKTLIIKNKKGGLSAVEKLRFPARLVEIVSTIE